MATSESFELPLDTAGVAPVDDSTETLVVDSLLPLDCKKSFARLFDTAPQSVIDNAKGALFFSMISFGDKLTRKASKQKHDRIVAVLRKYQGFYHDVISAAIDLSRLVHKFAYFQSEYRSACIALERAWYAFYETSKLKDELRTIWNPTNMHIAFLMHITSIIGALYQAETKTLLWPEYQYRRLFLTSSSSSPPSSSP